MSTKKYRNYFQIDESYFPAVNEDVIRTQPDVWKSYYPHESFIKLLKQVKEVLNGNQKVSIWVEGPYGTGKSHAVLTLKKILECPNDELKEYFDKFSTVFKTNDLYNEYYNLKNQSKKILTVHRYGSSDVRNDRVLMEIVQDSIILSLKQNNYSYLGQIGIKEAMIKWLEDDNNRDYFDKIIRSDEYKLRFNGLSANTILENLKTFTSEKALQEIIEKISLVGEEKGIKPFVLRKEDLSAWISDVIEKNNIKAIVFIWDEFSDYFTLNRENLSGFQYLAELSETNPFYFVIVTHKSDIFFEKTNEDVKTKINGRFMAPHCSIELPDNTAFVLTAHAMQKVEDEQVMKEWDETVNTLYNLTNDSRNEVISAAKVGEKELKGVLPIHPYAAVVLKHIASAFDSNQRSMFDFIKNDRGDEIKSFQWYIDNYGPEDEDNLLTVDMLWDFFYEKGKDMLAPQIRSILDVYGRTQSHNLLEKQKRVLKTILLLQAINEKVGDDVLMFVPNSKNVSLAFEGTDISPNNVVSLADGLVKEQIIFIRPMGGGKEKYSALVSGGNLEEIEKEKERLTREIDTSKLIEEGAFSEDFNLPVNITTRYRDVRYLTYKNIRNEVVKLKANSEYNPTKLYAVFTFARNDEEEAKVRDEIKRVYEVEKFDRIVFMDYSSEHMPSDLFTQYIDNMANCNYQKAKDASQSKVYDRTAKEALRRWKNKILASQFIRVCTPDNISGKTCTSSKEVHELLRMFDEQNFEYALETHVNVLDTMYAANSFRLGAECGITRELKNTFRSANEATKLEKQFEAVWDVEDYWIKKPNELLSKVKNAIENRIQQKMSDESRISIADIYEVLTDKPFGFMPCNLSAFVLGFVLKEYANDTYNWTDGLTTTPMSVEKLKEMIDEVLKQQQTPSSKYKDKYIVSMTPEQRAFNKNTALSFGIDESLCSSIENTRSHIRSSMNTYKFPIWTLKYLENYDTKTNSNIIFELIDLYVELANNTESARSETDIALNIGKLFLANSDLVTDFKNLLTKENCILGMRGYLSEYKDGVLLHLAEKLNDPGSYIEEINNKFSEATNWVWNKQTVDEKIDETITEYNIVVESNEQIVTTSSYNECLAEWAKKAKNFKVSFNTIKAELGSLYDFLSIVYQIKKNGFINDNNKSLFLNCLIGQSNEFKEFCETQNEWFKKAGSFYLDDLSDEDISNIASTIYDVFDKENSEFQIIIDNKVKDYKADTSKYKLMTIWKEKTESNNPADWSNKYCLPILCMIEPKEQENARNVFDIINNPPLEKKKIDEAIDYLESSHFYEDLNNEDKRREQFKRAILKNYSVLLEDQEEVKNQLKTKFPEIAPYYWIGNSVIESYIENLAYQNYIKGMNSKVNEIIDSMSPDELKSYLKSLVNENMAVGIEIINSKK